VEPQPDHFHLTIWVQALLQSTNTRVQQLPIDPSNQHWIIHTWMCYCILNILTHVRLKKKGGDFDEQGRVHVDVILSGIYNNEGLFKCGQFSKSFQVSGNTAPYNCFFSLYSETLEN